MKTLSALSVLLLAPLATAGPQGLGVLPERAAALERVQAGPAPQPAEPPPLAAAALSPGILGAATTTNSPGAMKSMAMTLGFMF